MCRSIQRLARAGAMAALLLGPAAAWAQDTSSETPTSLLAATPAPRADAALSPLEAFSFEGTTDGGNVTLKYGGAINRLTYDDDHPGRAKGIFGTYSIALSAPINEDGDFTSPLTHDGLSNAASVKLQLSQLVVPGVTYTGDAADDGPICTRMRESFLAKNPGAQPPGCGTESIANVLGVKDAEAFNNARAGTYAKRLLTYRGAFAKVGYKEYTYYDPTTLAEGELERTPWRVGGFWGFIGGDRGWAVTAEYAHEVSFEAAPSKTTCLAGAGPLLDCVSGSLGRAAKVTKEVLSLEGRLALGKLELGKVKPSIGLAPKVVYDAKNDDWAVALPVYLFSDKTGLTGGVRADWESNAHDIIVGVFITKAFSV